MARNHGEIKRPTARQRRPGPTRTRLDIPAAGRPLALAALAHPSSLSDLNANLLIPLKIVFCRSQKIRCNINHL